MAGINMGSVMSKVKAYASSDAGTKRIDRYISDCVRNGKSKTESGGTIVTKEMMETAAVKLIHVINSTANDYDVPASISNLLATMDYTNPIEKADGTWTVTLYFTGDTSRESLFSDQYEGVDNIIAVLNNGYSARDYVYGFWDNHKTTGDNNLLRTNPGDNFAYVRSMKERPGLHFIQQAVRDFDGNYGSLYNVTTIIGDDYK